MLKYWDGEKYVDVKELLIMEHGMWVKCNNIRCVDEYVDEWGISTSIFRAFGTDDNIEREFLIKDTISSYVM